MRVRQTAPAPVEESHKGIHDFLNWRQIPNTRCDMNFRVPWRPSRQHQRNCLILLFLAGFGGAVLTYLLQVFVAPIAASAVVLAASLVVSGLLGLLRLAMVIRSRTAGRWSQIGQIALWASAPLMLWLAVAGALLTHFRAGAVLYLATVSIPAACVAADYMCTHSLYWMSANPRIDLATLLSCRDAWSRRFWWCVFRWPIGQDAVVLSPELIRVLRSYTLRGPLVIASALLPVVLAVLVVHQSDLYIQTIALLTAISFGLVTLGILGAAGHRRPVRTFIYYLLHWLYSGEHRAVPPWVFRSPLGPPDERRIVPVLMLLLFTPAVIGLTDWLSIFPSTVFASSETVTTGLAASSLLGKTLVEVVLRALLVAVVPPAVFILTILSFAGPVICQLDHILEGK